MKKITAFVLGLVFIFSLVGCNNVNDKTVVSGYVSSLEGEAGSFDKTESVDQDDLTSENKSDNETDSKTDSKDKVNSKPSSKVENSSKKNNNSSSKDVNQNISEDLSSNDNTSHSDTSSNPSGINDTSDKPADNTSSSNSSTESDINNTSSNQSNNDNGTVDVAKCKHSYSQKIFPPTCDKQGYTLFTCPKCNDSYKDEYVPANHQFVDYICSDCGIGDSENAWKALIYWVVKNQNNNSNICEYTLETDDGIYSLMTISKKDDITLSFKNSDESEVFEMEIYDSEKCKINYILDGEGCGDKILSKKDIMTSESNIAENFTPPGEMKPQDFNEKLYKRINSTLLFLNDEILTKKLQLKIEDLGFVAEIATLDEIKE